ncbi:hypothetical protein VHEMI06752 [[Torrubiella] hemipterigena]|uniref:Phenazine biosynthesis PhzC/PhzF protein n=1 Tax=[Torrubiella] hemipterigena TaxID=1531966 RepID=A0A0A1TK64_9HYPO|nr:hypothetical protein VHEMI06752 [[Torrubiella] hemipterigena]
MELPFETYDVFTTTRYLGNALGVVTIPADAVKPTQEQKQAIAREFNLSETIFIHQVADPATNKQRQIDIFVTDAELPFAGHPVIGAAVSLLDEGVDTIITKAGPIPVRKTGDQSAQAAVPFNTHLHQKRLRDAAVAADQLSDVAVIRDAELQAPLFSIVKGMNFYLTELPDLNTLGRVTVGSFNPPQELLDEEWRVGFAGIYYFVRLGDRVGDDGIPVVSLRTRMVAGVLGIEDPATGSASCCLCSYLSTVASDQKVPFVKYEITQGVEMGKESSITVVIGVKDGKLDSVSLSGAAVRVMKGVLTI